MSDKRHKRKHGYTIMIISDSAEKNQKKFHVNTEILSGVAFVLLLAAVCYAEYTAILSHGATKRSETYVLQIATLQQENKQLLQENEKLQKQTANLNQTLLQMETQVQLQEKTKQETVENMPKGSPVKGVAQIKEAGGNAGMQANKEQKEVIFIAATGTNAVAAGAGKVAGILPGADGEPSSISIDHGNGYISNYRNVGAPKVEAGSAVEQGTVLFSIEENNTEVGYSVSKDNIFLEPMEIIEIKG